MRTLYVPPHALGRQLAQWRQPLDADPEVDAAVMRMLSAIDRRLQRQEEPAEQEG